MGIVVATAVGTVLGIIAVHYLRLGLKRWLYPGARK